MADVTETTEVRALVVVDFTESDMPYSFGTTHRSSLPEVEDAEVATVELAGRVQDDVLEELWGPPWPECPQHGHPAGPALAGQVAAWTCPTDHRAIGRVGSLGSRTDQ